MFDRSQQPLPINRSPPAPAEAFTSSPDFDDDLALGCESADPCLQIERWRQEVLPLPATPS